MCVSPLTPRVSAQQHQQKSPAPPAPPPPPLISPYLFERRDREKVPLRQRGRLRSAHVVIQSTEALTAIDVNAGGVAAQADGTGTLEVNVAAAEVAARELRRRNIGGKGLVDYQCSPRHHLKFKQPRENEGGV